MSPARRHASPQFLSLLLFSSSAAGCYRFASTIGSNLSDGVFQIAAVVLGLFGILGLALVVSVLRYPVSWLTLFVCWLGGGFVIAASASATEMFSPWPGTVEKGDLVLLWLVQAWAFAPIIATWKLVVERTKAPRPARLGWLVPAGIYAVVLGVASARGYATPPVDGKVVDVAVLDDLELQRTDEGMVIAWGNALPGRYKKLRAGTVVAIALDDTDRLVTLPLRTRQRATAVETGGPVIDIAAADSVGCFSTRSGAFCFDPVPGSRTGVGQAPARIDGLDDVEDLEMSWNILCGIGRGGRVLCTPLPTAEAPVQLFGTERVREIVEDGAIGLAVMGDGVCVLTTAKRVLCTTERAENPPPDTPAAPAVAAVPSLEGVAEIVAGTFHACARNDDGAVFCWGGNGWRQLGPGAAAKPNATPVAVPLPAKAVALFGHRTSTCARVETGEIHCWGAQKEPGAVIGGEICDDPFFGPPTVCSANPQRIVLWTTAIPFRD